jgi:cell division protein FtsI (penicillin-binding protein 3)
MKRARFARGRLLVVYLSVVVIWLGLSARLVQIQLFMHERAVALVKDQMMRLVHVPANRGLILDCKGRILVKNVMRTSFFAVPAKWLPADARRAAKRFASLGSRSESAWLERFEKSRYFVYVLRAADSSEIRRIRSWGDSAVFEIQEPAREYTTGGVGADLLGFVDVDGHGQAGVEAAFEDQLRGQDAQVRVDVTATRQATIVPLPVSAAVDGHNVQLTVDWEWQSAAEAAIDSTVRATKALGGGIILMTPDGAIRAIAYASNPERAPDARKNRVRPVTDIFEPGSIFKVISAIALLSERKVRLTDSVFAENGEWRVMGRTLGDSEKHGWLTFAESFVVSSNIAFAKWAQRLDGTLWYRWVHDFGFGDVTGVGLPAEPRGIIPAHAQWNELHKAQLAMGHSVAVTALQMLAAFAALANGGDLYTPHLLQTVTSAAGDTVETGEARKIRHLISQQVIQQMKPILLRVVTDGTAKVAHSDVIDVAGKTGTAQKVKSEGGYYPDKYVSSFVGYFPADQPQVVGIVYLDEPRTIHYGGYTAAPTFTHLAERLAALEPTLLRFPQPEKDQAPPVDVADPPMQAGVLPDLSGLPLSRAIICASLCGFLVEAEGTGFVVQQSPAPGTTLDSCRTVKLVAAVGNPPDSTQADSTTLAYAERSAR